MLLAFASRAAPALLRQCPAALGTLAAGRGFAAGAAQKPPTQPDNDDADSYELLPPGCSLADPTYGRSFGAGGKNSLSDPVLIYDQKPAEEYRPLKKRKPLPSAPLNVAAAQAKLQESKDAKKKGSDGTKDDDDELYVYVPPGSSLRDPLPSSMSDPLDNRKVYYRDPSPTVRSK